MLVFYNNSAPGRLLRAGRLLALPTVFTYSVLCIPGINSIDLSIYRGALSENGFHVTARMKQYHSSERKYEDHLVLKLMLKLPPRVVWLMVGSLYGSKVDTQN